ncbi:hypothetical protein [Allomuricauda sp. d1]|uniref:hypothetical protein n=1 Tax=Allomuricauda sp. d1 TaxID=3136725 RepID=UPI0031DA0120
MRRNTFKTVLAALFIITAFACEGPQGPPGPPGLDGLDGADTIATVFQESVSFEYLTEANTWVSDILSYDGVLEGDVFLVYISFGNDLYTPLPASVFDEFGEFQYVFDHDINTVELQIIGDSDLSGLDAASTQNIPVRVAIIPADFRSEFNAQDFISLEKVMDISGLDVNDIKHIER